MGYQNIKMIMNTRIEKEKLTIPIYLNTKIVFDMLATIEDGFSTVRSFQTSKNTSKEDEVDANIGLSNIFSFLSVSLQGNRKTANETDETVNENRTHTTVSLFQKLKLHLEEKKLIIREIDGAVIGDFVEIQGIFKTNPVIDVLSGMKELMVLADLFSDESKQKKVNQGRKDKVLQENKIYTQIDGLIKGLQVGSKKDIICEAESISIILPTDENYFLNGNMYEVTDGNYKVLGKIVSIYKEKGKGKISLLRNTVFSRLQLEKMKEFQDFFNNPSFETFTGEKGLKTEIEAPVMMVIPIAIYI